MFRMLNMSSASAPGLDQAGHDDDRTARARIRDAALHLFGARGFRSSTVRDIADRAGVSAALVVHHFGSKEGLRAAVDRDLLDQIHAGNVAAMTGSMTWSRDDYEDLLAQHAPTLAYLARSLSEDSELGRRFYDRLHADTIDAMQAGVAAGVLVPTDDESARAAAVLNADLGNMLLLPHLRRVLGAPDDPTAMLRLAEPLLDLYTDGIFTDDRFRAAFRSESRHDARTHDPDPPASRVGDATTP